MLDSEQEQILQEEITSLVQKEAVVRVAPNQNQFISNMFTIPKKDRGYQPIINLKPLNRFLLYQHFKIKGLLMVQYLIELLHVQNRSERCISNSPNHPKGLKVLKVSMETGAISVSDTSIRSGLCSKNLYKTYETSSRSSKKVRIYIDNILILSRSKEKLVQSRNTNYFY